MSTYGAHLISQYLQTAIETISFFGVIFVRIYHKVGCLWDSQFKIVFFNFYKIYVVMSFFKLNCPKYPPLTETSQKRGDKPFNKPRQTNLGHRRRSALFVPSTISKQMFEKKNDAKTD